MIRPLTIATCLLACGSGLYLYQSKHEVQLLDRTIERTVHDTTTLREQSRLLAAEWTMLNDPERLRQFSDTYLSLKTITPSQFTSLADLDSRLPAPRPATPPNGTEPDGTDGQASTPVVAEAAHPIVPDAGSPSDTDADAPADAVVADEGLPVPPIPTMPSSAPVIAPAARLAETPPARVAETRTVDRVPVSRPMAADSQSHPAAVADARPSDQRPPEQRAAPRVADVRPPVAPAPRPIALAASRPLPASTQVNTPPMQYRQPVAASPAPYGGSLLGMARGSMPPAPRPTPVNAAYNSN
jgi:hypothetical protein